MRFKMHVTELTAVKTASGYDFVAPDGRLAGRVERGLIASKRFWIVLVFTNGQSTEPNHPKGGASSLEKAKQAILRDHVTQARFAPVAPKES